MQPFVINRHGKLVFPSNFIPDLDFSVIETEEQLDQVIRRDFETKAPSGTEIGLRIEQGKYKVRVHLMRDVALNLFWVNRFAMTMYEKVPTRWRDVPRTRGDVFLPVVQPWLDKESKVSAVANAYDELPSGGDQETEDRVWKLLFDVFGNRKHHASALEAIRLLQEVNRPVLLVCGEKFSDKIGTVRPSRMIFGDGAAAVDRYPGGVLRPRGGHQTAHPAVPGGRCRQAVQGAAQDRGIGRGSW